MGFMKFLPARKILFIAILAILTVLTVPALLSCGDDTLRMKNDGNTGNLIDEENGRYYIFCRGYLQAAAINPAVYAKGDQGEILYEVYGVDPAEWISEDISKGIAFIFREQSVEEPKFEEFGAVKIHVTIEYEINVGVDVIEDRKTVNNIVNDYIYNQEVYCPEYIPDTFNFYFESEKYKGIYYVLKYLIDEENNAYLYDGWTGRCVPCSFNPFKGNDTGNDDEKEG